MQGAFFRGGAPRGAYRRVSPAVVPTEASQPELALPCFDAFGRVTAVWVLHRGSTVNRSYFFISDNPERETHSAPGPWRNIRRGR